MTLNAKLTRTKHAPNDELYTSIVDVAHEVPNYDALLRGKHILSNCGSGTPSAFSRYFRTGRHGIASFKELHYNRETGAGDFRSEEGRRAIAEADVVIANPPFSLIRSYVPQILDAGKDLLILGPLTAIAYGDIAPYIVAGRLWNGVHNTGTRFFATPDGGVTDLRNVVWYTTLDHEARHRHLTFTRKYSPHDYQFCDDYAAIFVSRVADIPADYRGVMAVPLTYLAKHNPEDFHIRGIDDRPMVEGRPKFSRIFIQRKEV